jgi:predicted dehydrogenase
VVYVGILNQTHCPWVCACLERGKNVLCEKPMGQSRAETEKIAAKAREKGLFVMEVGTGQAVSHRWKKMPFSGPVEPFLPGLAPAACRPRQEAVRGCQADPGHFRHFAGQFGTLFFSHSFTNLYHFFQPSNRFDVSISECPAVDIGIYCVQFAMFCMDDQQPSVIKAHAVKNADGVDICGQFCLEFGGEGEKAQARASLLYNTEVPCPNSAFVAFEKGIFEVVAFQQCFPLKKVPGSDPRKLLLPHPGPYH